MKRIVIIGDSGHSKVVADVIQSNDDMIVIGKLDDKYEQVFIEDKIVKGPVNHLQKLMDDEPELGIIFGIGSNLIRKKLVLQFGLSSEMYANAVHASAVVSPSAEIGFGTVVMPGAIINADARIGEHAIVNSGSVIEHDCNLGDFVHISPQAVLSGGVSVGVGTHIGVATSIIPLKKIGAWSILGAGAVVVTDIKDRVTAVGIPAKPIKVHEE